MATVTWTPGSVTSSLADASTEASSRRIPLERGLRPGEARTLDAQDVEVQGDRYFIKVSKAAKGKHAHAPIGPTKTGSSRRVPVSPDLAEWLSKHWGPRVRLANGPPQRNVQVRWALQDSNLGASGYEPAALTAELRALRVRGYHAVSRSRDPPLRKVSFAPHVGSHGFRDRPR